MGRAGSAGVAGFRLKLGSVWLVEMIGFAKENEGFRGWMGRASSAGVAVFRLKMSSVWLVKIGFAKQM